MKVDGETSYQKAILDSTRQSKQMQDLNLPDEASRLEKRRPELKSTQPTKAQISERAKELLRVKELAKQAPDVREDRIEALKKQFEAGSYSVDAGKVADSLVDEHLSELG